MRSYKQNRRRNRFGRSVGFLAQFAIMLGLSGVVCSIIWALGDEPVGPLAGSLPSGLLPAITAPGGEWMTGPSAAAFIAERRMLEQQLGLGRAS